MPITLRCPACGRSFPFDPDLAVPSEPNGLSATRLRLPSEDTVLAYLCPTEGMPIAFAAGELGRIAFYGTVPLPIPSPEPEPDDNADAEYYYSRYYGFGVGR